MNRRELRNLQDLYCGDSFEDRALAEEIMCYHLSDNDFLQMVKFIYYEDALIEKPLNYRYKHINKKNRKHDRSKKERETRSDKPPDE